ncbi:MAG: hypothetical protein WC655_14430 [Candidatus Hydrogenedentales bacterium]|jgi:hypothetical protein
MAMAKDPLRKARILLRLSADQMGMLAGASVAFVVINICFFVTQVEVMQTFLRTGLAFVVTYASVFLMVKSIQSATRSELKLPPPQVPAGEGGGATPQTGESGESA